MTYTWIDHTAELELHIDAPTEEAVFEQALQALAEVLGDDGGGDPVTVELALEAPDRGALLVAWIDELVYRAETAGLVPDAAQSVELDGARLTATVRAHRGAPRHVVKGATYHQLTFEPAPGGHRASVVLDV